MKLYACATIAVKQGGLEIKRCLVASAVTAISEEEAIGKAHKVARECAPSSDGWGQHDVSVVEVTDELIAEVSGGAPSEEHGE